MKQPFQPIRKPVMPFVGVYRVRLKRTSEDDEPCECHSIRRSPPCAAPQPTSPSPSPVRVDYTTPRHVSQTSQTPQDHSQSDTPRELPSTPPSSPPPSSLPSSSTSHRNRQQLVFTVVEQRPTSFDIAHPESDTPCEPPSTKSSQSPHPSPPLASSPCRKRPFAFTVREPTSPAKRPRQRSEQEGTESATSTSQTPTLADEPTPPTLEETEPGVSLAASTSNTSLSSIVSSSSDCDRYEDAPSLRIRRFVSKIKSLKVNFTWFEASGNEPLSSAPSFPAKVGDVFLYKHRGHPSLPDLDLNDRELLVAVQI
ncbi:hypothetical protein OF83DRAFT_1174819 [Amylostereum chailletii]|nr:hypothetical protein OF83DRAFT_1174819 [Amylostereum chailletii]